MLKASIKNLNEYDAIHKNFELNNKDYTAAGWLNAANKGQLESYVSLVAQIGAMDDDRYNNFKSAYEYDFLDEDEKTLARWTHLYADRHNLKNYTYVNADGKEVTERHTEYDWNNTILKDAVLRKKDEMARQAYDELQASKNIFVKIGEGVAGAGQLVLREILAGAASAMEGIYNIFEGTVAAGIAAAKGDDSEEAFRNAFTNDVLDKGYDIWRESVADWERDVGFRDYNYDTSWFYNMTSSISNSFGRMLPTFLAGQVAGVAVSGAVEAGKIAVDAGNKLMNGIAAANQYVFYASQAANNISEMLNDPEAAKLSTLTIVVSSVGRSAAELAIEKGLGTLVGKTISDRYFYGFEDGKGAITKGKLATSIISDIFKEGIEETLQDYSNYFIDTYLASIYRGMGNKEYADILENNSQFNFDVAKDAFLSGVIMSIIGIAGRFITTPKEYTGAIKTRKNKLTGEAEYVVDKNGNYVYEKFGKLKSFLLSETLESISNNISTVINDKDLTAKERSRAFNALRTTMGTLNQLYNNLGEERFNKAINMLAKLEENYKKGVNTYKEETFKAVVDFANNVAADYRKAKLTEYDKKRLKEAQASKPVEVLNKDSVKVTTETIETPEVNVTEDVKNAASEIFNGIDNLYNIVILEDLSAPVLSQDGSTLYVTSDQLKSIDPNGILKDVAHQSVITTITTNKKFAFGADRALKLYNEYAKLKGLKEGDTYTTVDMLITDGEFVQYCLGEGDKTIVDFIVALQTLRDSIIASDLKSAYSKVQLDEAAKNIKKILINYYGYMQYASYMDKSFFTIDEKKQITALRARYDITNRFAIGMQKSNFKPTDADTRVFYELLNNVGNAEIRENIKNMFENGNYLGAVKEINKYNRGTFYSIFDGHIYPTMDSPMNAMFYNFLLNSNTTIDALYNLGDDDFDAIADAFYDYTTGTFSLEKTEDSVRVVEMFAENGDKSITYKISEKYKNKSLGDSFFKTVTDESFAIDKFLSPDVEFMYKNIATVNDIINDPDLLSTEVKSAIIDEYGYLTPESIYKYIDAQLRADTDGNISIGVAKDGTYYLANLMYTKALEVGNINTTILDNCTKSYTADAILEKVGAGAYTAQIKGELAVSAKYKDADGNIVDCKPLNLGNYTMFLDKNGNSVSIDDIVTVNVFDKNTLNSKEFFSYGDVQIIFTYGDKPGVTGGYDNNTKTIAIYVDNIINNSKSKDVDIVSDIANTLLHEYTHYLQSVSYAQGGFTANIMSYFDKHQRAEIVNDIREHMPNVKIDANKASVADEVSYIIYKCIVGENEATGISIDVANELPRFYVVNDKVITPWGSVYDYGGKTITISENADYINNINQSYDILKDTIATEEQIGKDKYPAYLERIGNLVNEGKSYKDAVNTANDEFKKEIEKASEEKSIAEEDDNIAKEIETEENKYKAKKEKNKAERKRYNDIVIGSVTITKADVERNTYVPDNWYGRKVQNRLLKLAKAFKTAEVYERLGKNSQFSKLDKGLLRAFKDGDIKNHRDLCDYIKANDLNKETLVFLSENYFGVKKDRVALTSKQIDFIDKNISRIYLLYNLARNLYKDDVRAVDKIFNYKYGNLATAVTELMHLLAAKGYDKAKVNAYFNEASASKISLGLDDDISIKLFALRDFVKNKIQDTELANKILSKNFDSDEKAYSTIFKYLTEKKGFTEKEINKYIKDNTTTVITETRESKYSKQVVQNELQFYVLDKYDGTLQSIVNAAKTQNDYIRELRQSKKEVSLYGDVGKAKNKNAADASMELIDVLSSSTDDLDAPHLDDLHKTLALELIEDAYANLLDKINNSDTNIDQQKVLELAQKYKDDIVSMTSEQIDELYEAKKGSLKKVPEVYLRSRSSVQNMITKKAVTISRIIGNRTSIWNKMREKYPDVMSNFDNNGKWHTPKNPDGTIMSRSQLSAFNEKMYGLYKEADKLVAEQYLKENARIQNASIGENLSDKSAKIRDLENTKKIQEKAFETYKNETDGTIAKLEKQLDKAKADLEKAKSKGNISSDKLASLKETVNSLKDNINTLKNDVKTKKKQVTDLKNELAALKGEVETLRAKSGRPTKISEINTYGDTTLITESNRRMPEPLKELLNYVFTGRRVTKGRFTNVNEMHTIKSYNKWIKDNAKNLANITPENANDILDYIVNSSTLVPGYGVSADDISTYNAIMMFTYSYLYEHRYEYNLEANLLTRVEERFDDTVSNAASILGVSKALMKKTNVDAIILEELSVEYGIRFYPNDIEDLRNISKRLANSNTDAERSACLEEARKIYARVYQDTLVQFKGDKQHILDKIWRFQRAAMLSSPATWLRNIVSNTAIYYGNKMFSKIGDFFWKKADKLVTKIEDKRLAKLIKPVFDEKYINSLAAASDYIDFVSEDVDTDTINEYQNTLIKYRREAQAYREMSADKRKEHLANLERSLRLRRQDSYSDRTESQRAKTQAAIKDYELRIKVLSDMDTEFKKINEALYALDKLRKYSKDNEAYQLKMLQTSTRKTLDGQYKIVGVKVSDAVVSWIQREIIDSNLLNMISDGMNKLTPEVMRDKAVGETVDEKLVYLMKRSIATRVFNTNQLGVGPVDKIINLMFEQFMSDEKFVRKSFIKYLGAILTEKNIDVTKGITDNVLQYIVDAYSMASYDYMHTGNVISEFEKVIQKNLGKGAYFFYKQMFPFAGASYNWFVESLRLSPMGLAKSLYDLANFDKYINNMDKANAKGFSPTSRFASYILKRNIGKGVFGTVTWLLGALLAAFGVIRLEEDKQDGQMKIVLGDGVYLDFKNLYGSSGSYMGIATGLAFGNMFKDNSNTTILDVLGTVLDSMLADSIFTDIADMFQYNDSASDILEDKFNSMILTFVPNILKLITSSTYNRKIRYSKGFLGTLQRVAVQSIPGIAYAMPTKQDIYTGETQYKYDPSFWGFVSAGISKVSPIKVQVRQISDAELTALSYGIKKTELRGEYDEFKFSLDEKATLNKTYGTLNKKDLADLMNNKKRYTVVEYDKNGNKTGKMVEIYYRQMNDKQRKSVIERIMNNNATFAKIYTWTNSGHKYYCDKNEYYKLMQAGITKNIYIGNKGFVK